MRHRDTNTRSIELVHVSIAMLMMSVCFSALLVVNVQKMPVKALGAESTSAKWAVVGSADKTPQIENIFWLFGNQSIPYVQLSPNAVVDYEGIKQFAGLVLWTNLAGEYNRSAIKQFSETGVVISHLADFCSLLYPELNGNMVAIGTATVEYVIDWGNFRKGDNVEMHNGTYRLTGITTSSLASLVNVTTISKYSSTITTMFSVQKGKDGSGFLVLDLFSTTDNSYQAGNWPLFPFIAKVEAVKAGQYARWMTNGLSWLSLEQVYSWMEDFAALNNDIAEMRSIGTSVEGRPINALFIGKGARYFLADAAIHGVEKAGTCGLLRFAELLVEWFRTQDSWSEKLSQYKIILIPVLNPDGYVADKRDNANGKDLNRQFPPAGSTTEPEAWALRRLMDSYPPIQYASLHTGSDISPLHVYYSSPGGSYTEYAFSAANDGNQIFKNMQHWGIVFNDVWVGRYRYIGPLGSHGSLSASYAAYQHNAIGLTLEHWSLPKVNLHSQEFYISALISLLLHYDRTGPSIIHSDAFITHTTAFAGGLEIYLERSWTEANFKNETKICDLGNRGKPLLVAIDGLQKSEGNGWSWSSSTNTITVVDASGLVRVQWTFSCDVNQDGVVDMKDIVYVVILFNTVPSSPNWDPKADVNNDGMVNFRDLHIVIYNFKK